MPTITRRRLAKLRLFLGSLLALALPLGALPALARAAAAQDPTAPAPAAGDPAAGSPAAEVEGDAGGDGSKKKKKKDKQAAAEASGMDGAPALAAAQSDQVRIEVKGRVFASAIYEDQRVAGAEGGARSDVDGLDLTVNSARFGVKVEILDYAALVVEAEMAGRARLRDGYVQAKRKHWMARAGQFKMPISIFTLESPWTLPLARRGHLDDLLSERLLLSGRREGMMAQVSGGGFWDPALTVGAFRPVTWGLESGDPIERLSLDQQTLVGRLSVTPGGVEVAAVGERRFTVADGAVQSYWAAGLESTGDFEFERTGVRFWLEGMTGSSWLSFGDTFGRERVIFLTGRAMVAWRWGGLTRGAPYVEPYATVGVLDPDADAVADRYLETMAGVNVGHWRRTRLTLQFELGAAPRNFPGNYFLGFGKEMLVDHRAVILQVGAAF